MRNSFFYTKSSNSGVYFTLRAHLDYSHFTCSTATRGSQLVCERRSIEWRCGVTFMHLKYRTQGIPAPLPWALLHIGFHLHKVQNSPHESKVSEIRIFITIGLMTWMGNENGFWDSGMYHFWIWVLVTQIYSPAGWGGTQASNAHGQLGGLLETGGLCMLFPVLNLSKALSKHSAGSKAVVSREFDCQTCCQ